MQLVLQEDINLFRRLCIVSHVNEDVKGIKFILVHTYCRQKT